jgi:hypothetical protein
VIGDVYIDAVASEADVVGYDLRAAAVIELDAIAALCRSQITHAGDIVADDLNVFHLLDPQPEQGVVDGVIADNGAVTARRIASGRSAFGVRLTCASFSWFRPADATVRGISGDPRARIITPERRSTTRYCVGAQRGWYDRKVRQVRQQAIESLLNASLDPLNNARMIFVLSVAARYRPGHLHKAVREFASIVRIVPEINNGCGNDGG